MEFTRFTTEYIDFEDRFRLTAETDGGERVLLWLTQRLLQRLMPVLLQWLEKQTGRTPHAEVLQGFAQQAARSELQPQAPVPAEAGGAGWLVQSVDIAQSPRNIRLTFRSVAGEAASVTLEALPLRQWLNILHDAYCKAEWRHEGWPEWAREGAASGGRPDAAVH